MTDTPKKYIIKTDTEVDGYVKADRFIGTVEGAMEEAVVATKDSEGNEIASTYISSISTGDGKTVVTTHGDGTDGPTVTMMGYAEGTGLGKAVDGMTTTFSVEYGATAGTACEGNDARLSDAREPLAHTQASDTIGPLTGYTVASMAAPISDSDSLNQALGKLEKSLSLKQDEISVAAPITSGTVGGVMQIGHADTAVGAGTYTKVTVDTKGHVTGGDNPVTLGELGVSDDVTMVRQDALPAPGHTTHCMLMAGNMGTAVYTGHVTKAPVTCTDGMVAADSFVAENRLYADTIVSKTLNGRISVQSPMDIAELDVTAIATPTIHADAVYTDVLAAKTDSISVTSPVVQTSSTTQTGNLTLTGTLTINGSIVQNGAAYDAHAQQIYTADDYIIMRDGAAGALSAGQYSGFQIKLYDGTHDGRLVVDNTGTARVGDVGDEQPLLTRAEANNMYSNGILIWDASNTKAVAVDPTTLISGYTNFTSTQITITES